MVIIRGIQIVNYWHRTSYGMRTRLMCGIEIIDEETGYSFAPTYPFAELAHREALQEFVDLYEKDLLDFYVNEVDYDLARALTIGNYQTTPEGYLVKTFESMDKEHFRNYWFEKGVVFY